MLIPRDTSHWLGRSLKTLTTCQKTGQSVQHCHRDRPTTLFRGKDFHQPSPPLKPLTGGTSPLLSDRAAITVPIGQQLCCAV